MRDLSWKAEAPTDVVTLGRIVGSQGDLTRAKTSSGVGEVESGASGTQDLVKARHWTQSPGDGSWSRTGRLPSFYPPRGGPPESSVFAGPRRWSG